MDDTAQRRRRLGDGQVLLLAALTLGAALTLAVVPGVFTIDENNYLVSVLAARQGRVSLPGTDGLPPSPELAYFDPALEPAHVRSPVSSTVPPLYAPLALPFAALGFRGLIALNMLATLVTAGLVFSVVRRHAPGERAGPWLASAAFVLGSYVIEYALGAWPHMLSAALVTGAFVTASRARELGRVREALLAGALAGLATETRYQNIVVAGGLGLGLLVLSQRGRLRVTAGYAVGLLPPLVAAATINHARFQSWNPISKGSGYLYVTARDTPQAASSPILTALRGFWARVVDHSAHPAFSPEMARVHAYMHKDPETGAVFIGEVVKKAWLQSAPWLALALALLAAAWVARERSARGRDVRAMGLVVFPTLAGFAASSFARTDGLCFNQRYFIELLPLAAMAVGIALGSVVGRRAWLLGGALGGVLLAWGLLQADVHDAAVVRARLYAPVALAAALLVAWALRRRAAGALAVALGASLGWALTVHLGEDIPESLRRRARNAVRAEEARPVIPARAALLEYGSNAFGPLQLDHDLVILDARVDSGEDAPKLIASLRARGRRILLAMPMPDPVVARIVGNHRLVRLPGTERHGILELE
jgi:hypothetical protein